MSSFLQFLTFRQIRWRNSGKPGEIWMACPFCGDTDLRLGLNLFKDVAHCFRGTCGWKTGKEAKAKVAYRISREKLDFQSDGAARPDEVRAIDLPTGFFLLADVNLDDDGVDAPALRYMLDRGVWRETLKRYFVGATVDEDSKQCNRVVFPVNYGRELFGYVGRSYTDRKPKYLNSDGTRGVWGLEPAKPDQMLVMTEGAIKSIAITQVTDTFGVGAVLGNALSDLQIELIRKAGYRRVAYIPDPGGPGIEGGIKILDQLHKESFEPWVPWPLPAKQCDDYTPDELFQLLGTFTRWGQATYTRMRKALHDEWIENGLF